MKKVFVLRTEALLASKDPTLRFGDDNTIVVPMAILQNLYRYKGVPEATCALWIMDLLSRKLLIWQIFRGLTIEFSRFVRI